MPRWSQLCAIDVQILVATQLIDTNICQMRIAVKTAR